MGHGGCNQKKKSATRKKPSNASFSAQKQDAKEEQKQNQECREEKQEEEQKQNQEQKHKHYVNRLILAVDLWNSLGVEAKKRFLEVKIKDIMEKSCPGTTLEAELPLALREGGSEVWFCFKCNQLFSEKGDYMLHLESHLSDYILGLYMLSPPVSAENLEFIQEGVWEPINASEEMELAVSSSFASCDEKRRQLLQAVQKKLKTLSSHDCLADGQVDMMQFLIEKPFENCPLQALLRLSNLNFSLCASKGPGLENVLTYLEILLILSQLDSVGNRCFDDDDNNVSELDPDVPKVLLSSDKTSLILDTKTFRKEEVSDAEGVDAMDTNKWVCWLFTALPFGDEWLGWNDLVDQKTDMIGKIFKKIECQFSNLQEAIKKKFHLCAYMSGLNDAYNLQNNCCNEGRSFDWFAALCTRKQELAKAEYCLNNDLNEFEHLAITALLKRAEKLQEETFSVLPHESLESAFYNLKQHMYLLLNYEEARLRGSVYNIRKLADLVEANSHFNYTSFFLPLVNSYLRAELISILDGDINAKLVFSEATKETSKASPERNSVSSDFCGSEMEERFDDDDDDIYDEIFESEKFWNDFFWK